jgi:hypothetical protein
VAPSQRIPLHVTDDRVSIVFVDIANLPPGLVRLAQDIRGV